MFHNAEQLGRVGSRVKNPDPLPSLHHITSSSHNIKVRCLAFRVIAVLSTTCSTKLLHTETGSS